MKIGKVLDQIKGLTKNQLLYWVRKGYIQPKKIQKEKIEWNEFSEQDLAKAKLMDHYAHLGCSSQQANERAEEELRKRLSFHPIEVIQVFHDLSPETPGRGVFFAPDVDRDSPEPDYILNKATITYNSEDLYFLTVQLIDLLEEDIAEVGSIVTLDSAASAIVGGMSILSYQKRGSFPLTFSSEYIKEGVIHDSEILLIGGKVLHLEATFQTIKELEEKGCKIKKLVILLTGKSKKRPWRIKVI